MKSEKPLKDRPDDEQLRAVLLHRICSGIAARVALGETGTKAFRLAVDRSRRGEFKLSGDRRLRLTIKTLIRHYYAWRKAPTPKTFLLQYKPGKTPTPVLLEREFLRRCFRVKTENVAEAIASLEAQWRKGRPVPGLGKWRTYVRRTPHLDGMETAPKLPFASALRRRLSRADTKQLRSLREMSATAQSALAAFQKKIMERVEQ